MDARELRIGNKVNESSLFTPQKEDFSIIEIAVINTIDNIARDTDDIIYLFDYLYGIPLTPEILIACGFEKIPHKMYGHVYEKYNKDLAQDWTFRTVFYRDDILLEPFGKDCGHIGVYYLHKLQNIVYSLTGEELKVQLPHDVESKL